MKKLALKCYSSPKKKSFVSYSGEIKRCLGFTFHQGIILCPVSKIVLLSRKNLQKHWYIPLFMTFFTANFPFSIIPPLPVLHFSPFFIPSTPLLCKQETTLHFVILKHFSGLSGFHIFALENVSWMSLNLPLCFLDPPLMILQWKSRL